MDIDKIINTVITETCDEILNTRANSFDNLVHVDGIIKIKEGKDEFWRGFRKRVKEKVSNIK